MIKFERFDKILSLLNSVPDGKIRSKKKLHKLVYLLQQAREDFDQDFTFHYYGVFSPSLARDIDSAKELGLIGIEQHQSGYGYDISLTPAVEVGKIAELGSRGQGILGDLADKDAQLLEVLSTIVYLDRNFYHGSELKQKLKALKPDLSVHYEEAYGLATKLFAIELTDRSNDLAEKQR